MNGKWSFLLLLLDMAWLTPLQASEKEPLRFWKDTKGREIIGELVASDGVRVTLRVEDNSKKVLPLTLLCAADREFIASWRKTYPLAPWVDPETMPTWPQNLGSGPVKVRRMPADEKTSDSIYRSPHFELRSDIELPLFVVSDMAAIFEATRIALHRLPLGLAASPPLSEMQLRLQHKYPKLKYDPDLLQVQLYHNPESFAQAGAPPGSGGFYNSMQNRTFLSLTNLGIKHNKTFTRSEYMKSAFVLKHEITHHLLHDWAPYLPVWFQEGFAEYLGAVPYSQGRYHFTSMDRHLIQYLNKWRFNEDPKRIPMMKLEDLMTSQPGDWDARLQRSTPILEYNSAALLVHFFIHHDDQGNAAHLAAYLHALRQGLPSREAEKSHLLRQRTYPQLASEIRQVWKKRGVTLFRHGEEDPFARRSN